MKEMTIVTVGDLRTLAERVLAEVKPPRAKRAGATVLALHGELGAGKTSFVQVLAKLLGVEQSVTSPTFVVMRMYPTAGPCDFSTLVHIDAYRVESPDEMRVIGLVDVLREPANLVCIEWAERIKDDIPPDALHVTFTHDPHSPNGSSRTVTYG
ncbi:tRNA (adenosine(37)-N6)-threonylcarbamoyltransferase complex ATPase subunit type 1 TsaE [Candidatus Kaiserbacteria bacterium]|nr:tRNA (adenosine(37)-N6)-threonylcarbamoyltransferase complex ATPase subunit type 1 TsaE [Candidatus Kaiserbacteria bacterium]